MPDLTAVRAGLAANLSAIEDLQVSPYFLSSPTFPSAFVRAGEGQFDLAGSGGMDKQTMFVRVLVAPFGDIGPGVNLDAYLAGTGPRSIKQAIEANPDLDGACDDLIVRSHEGEREYVFEDRPSALGTEFTVDVYGVR